MRNIAAIFQKELKSYFASPIAYVVLGFFALIFGYFYFSILVYFVRQSLQMGMEMGPEGHINVNQMMIRPLLLNTSVIALFLLPMITMRLYAEEKRSGTIELLMTSPVSDFQIIMGKFLAAVGLYASMLALSAVSVAVLYVYGQPETRPILSGYLGLLLLGASFLSVGLLISSLTKNQIVAATATFGVFLLLWVIGWIGTAMGPTGEKIVNYLSITEHFDDFAKGVIDTKDVVYYLSFIAFGLFLTAKAVETERWKA